MRDYTIDKCSYPYRGYQISVRYLPQIERWAYKATDGRVVLYGSGYDTAGDAYAAVQHEIDDQIREEGK